MAALNISTITSAHFLFLLHESLATLLIGIIVAAMLFGIISIQAFAYFQTSKSDPVYLKLMIGTLLLLESLQIALHAHYAYFILVVNFFNPSAVGDVTWSISLFAVLSETSDFIIRMYYIQRIWIMSNRSLPLTFIAAVLNLAAFISGLGFGAKLCSLHTFTEVPDISWLMYTTLSLGVAADLWSALSLCYFLRKGGSDFQSTSTVINKLAIYVIGTGMLTSFVAIACLVSFTVKSNVGFYTAIYGCLSTFSFNALLATLNMRKHLRENMACMVGNNSQPRTTQSNLESQVNFESDVDNKSFAVTMKIQTVHHAD